MPLQEWSFYLFTEEGGFIMLKIGRKKIGNTTFYVQVVDDSVKVSSNRSATVEEMFNIADELLRDHYGHIHCPFSYFDDQGYLVLEEKKGRKKVLKKYNLDTTTRFFHAPIAHIMAYGNAGYLLLKNMY